MDRRPSRAKTTAAKSHLQKICVLYRLININSNAHFFDDQPDATAHASAARRGNWSGIPRFPEGKDLLESDLSFIKEQ